MYAQLAMPVRNKYKKCHFEITTFVLCAYYFIGLPTIDFDMAVKPGTFPYSLKTNLNRNALFICVDNDSIMNVPNWFSQLVFPISRKQREQITGNHF